MNCLGRAALRREQWEQLESNHHEKRARGKEGETEKSQAHPSKKKKWRYTCKLLE
jgi:hypothetical protein